MDQAPIRPDWLPLNYQPVPSKIAGISVFAPVAPETQADRTANFTCPQCGAPTRYNVSAGGVACEHCGFTSHADSVRVGAQAQDFEFTLDTLHKSDQGWGTERRDLHCDNCGAQISLSAGEFSVTCPFCSSSKVNVRPGPSDQLRPLFLVPFKIPPETNRSRVAEWLGKGWFHPAGLKASSVINQFSGAYLPFWTFSADISADWKAEVGYEHQENYYDSSDKSWKTRVVIQWRWENGRANLGVHDYLTQGSTHISQHILQQIYPFNLNDLVTYAPDFLAGWQAQSYDINLPAAWETGKNAMRDKAKDACYGQISSIHVRNFSMVADFANESWRYILLPVYIAAYKFEEKVYQVMVNGQTGVVAGQKPVAWWKFWLAIAAMLFPGLAIGLIGLPLLLAGGVGILPIGIGIILLVVGMVFAVRFYRKAVDSEAS